METYLYNAKTEEIYVNFKNTLDQLLLQYHQLNLDKDNFNRLYGNRYNPIKGQKL